MKHYIQALLVVELAIMALLFTSRIGETVAAHTLAWSEAWMAFATCAAFAATGALAGVEWANNRGNK
jgi:hypothetical protein